MNRVIPAPLILLLSMLALSLSAQSVQAQDTENRRTQLEQDIEEAGLIAGYATQCYEEEGDEETVDLVNRQVLAVAHAILRDSGSSLAFTFALNAGYGGGTDIDLDQCVRFVDDWQELIESFTTAEEIISVEDR